MRPLVQSPAGALHLATMEAEEPASEQSEEQPTVDKRGQAKLPLNIERRLTASEEQTEQEKGRFLAALERSLGNVLQARQATGIGRTTHYRWLKEDPDYKEAVELIADEAVDFGESKLFELMNGVSMLRETGKFDEDGEPIMERVYKRAPCYSSVQFFLRTRGKKAGYGDQQVIIQKETDVIDPKPLPGQEIPDYLKGGA